MVALQETPVTQIVRNWVANGGLLIYDLHRFATQLSEGEVTFNGETLAPTGVCDLQS